MRWRIFDDLNSETIEIDSYIRWMYDDGTTSFLEGVGDRRENVGIEVHDRDDDIGRQQVLNEFGIIQLRLDQSNLESFSLRCR